MLVEVNPEIIKKFQGEFISHIVDREAVSYLEEGEWHHANPRETSIWSRDSIDAVVYNDSSVMYRRALAEGKEVQQIKNNRWVKVQGHQLDSLVDTPKRIVPAQKFQEWDWVCFGEAEVITKIKKCTYNADIKLWEYTLAKTNHTEELSTLDENIKHWSPVPGETLAFCDGDGGPIVIDDFIEMRGKNYVCANELAYKHVSPIIFNLDMLYPASKTNGHK